MNTKTIQKIEISRKENLQKKSYNNMHDLVKTEILGVGITNATKENILEYIKNSLENTSRNYYIVTPNPEMIVLSHKNLSFRQALNGAEIALNDGVGVSLAGRLLAKGLTDRITGVDFMKSVCEKANVWPITVGFLGGQPHVAEKAAECLLSEFPKLNIVYAAPEWNDSNLDHGQVGSNHNLQATSYQLQAPIDILFVAFGAPKQELWMREHVGKIPVRVMVGVGGALDYVSGKVPRAPKWVQKIGLEWLFRLVVEPWRWRRQLALFEFIWLVLKERFSL